MGKTWVKDGCVRVSERAGVAGGNHVMPMALREGSPAALCCMETARPTKGRKGKKKRKEEKERRKEKEDKGKKKRSRGARGGNVRKSARGPQVSAGRPQVRGHSENATEFVVL